jgi:hypothetical protein
VRTKKIELTKKERALLLALINRAEIERDQKRGGVFVLGSEPRADKRRRLPPLRPAAFNTLEVIEAKLLDELE